MLSRRFLASAFALALASASLMADAQRSAGPQPVPLPQPIPFPVDKPYPGVIDLRVDLTDVARRIVQVSEDIPVKSGPLTILYPEWIPGTHSPTGPIDKMAGLVVTAKGKRLEWVRDKVDVFAFHIYVPTGVTKINASFQFLAPVRQGEGRISVTDQIADLAWNEVVLYPAGYFSRQETYAPSIKLPDTWQFATALEEASREGQTIRFKNTTLNTLVDSPLYAGAHFKRLDLSTGAENPVYLDVFADKDSDLAVTPEELQLHKNLAVQAQKLYASHHYNHYDFLLSVSDYVGGQGLEHHQSSEDGTQANYFTDWAAGVAGRDLLAHEYTHSWDGKFRRPAGLWTPNFDVPMQDELLWVYEGMTEYYGFVLTARSGLRTADQTRDMIAGIAANFEASPGRTWRPMVDTTNQPTISQRRPVSWVSWQRPEDYYTEGLLIWLDADTKIREMSSGRKSLDDFAKLFYGVDNGSFITRTYTLDDVVAALNTVQPYDWATFLHTHVDRLAPQVPEDGITRGGYKLVYGDTEPEWEKKSVRGPRGLDLSTSLGLRVLPTGVIRTVGWGSPAFQAKLISGMEIIAVNGTAYSADALRDAVLKAEKDKAPMVLLVKHADQIETVNLDYHGGLRYPTLQRQDGKPALLDNILAPVS